MTSPTHWSRIAPEDAREIVLPRNDIVGPVNEMGEPCPWPWEPQQLVGAPIGQYHCPHCGAMVMAGMPHVDYAELQTDPPVWPDPPEYEPPTSAEPPGYEMGGLW